MVFKYLFGGLSLLFLFSAVILPLFDDLPVNSYSPLAAPSIKDNAELIQSRRYFTQIKGAETIKISPKTGEMFTGSRDGKVWKILNDSVEEVGSYSGSKLNGFDFDADGNIIFADPLGGRLLKYYVETNKWEILATKVNGKPLKFVNDVAVSSNGLVYFSDSCADLGFHYAAQAFLRFLCSGRLAVYNPSTKETKLLVDGLCFPNGIVLDEEEKFLVIVVGATYSLSRYWLKGPKAGQLESFVENLPGMPDNIRLSTSKKGHYWVALIFARSVLLDTLHPFPSVKRLFLLIPLEYQPVRNYGLVALVDPNGNIVQTLHDPTGQTAAGITDVMEHDGKLYLGNTYFEGFNIYTLSQSD